MSEITELKRETDQFNGQMDDLNRPEPGKGEVVSFPILGGQEKGTPSHIQLGTHERQVEELDEHKLLSPREMAMLMFIQKQTGMPLEKIQERVREIGTGMSNDELRTWYHNASEAESVGVAPTTIEQAGVWRQAVNERLNHQDSPIPEQERVRNPFKILKKLFTTGKAA